jgi:hypothetical protein
MWHSYRVWTEKLSECHKIVVTGWEPRKILGWQVLVAGCVVWSILPSLWLKTCSGDELVQLFISWSPEISSLEYLPVSRKYICKYSETDQEIIYRVSVLISHSHWLNQMKSFLINLYHSFFDWVFCRSRLQASFFTVHMAEKFLKLLLCVQNSQKSISNKCVFQDQSASVTGGFHNADNKE